ncbi:1-(5-phosphoribosyl)-5-[(5-phosphoribosylamino)methylideneamino]imidazole-4-carboxamide isomerase [Magnetococcales bacterium HHB-1]
MIIIPAIDLKDGQCVRLFQGRMDQDTIYSDDPVAMAEKWQKQGAERLHLVDLNGAFAGELVNADVIKAICGAINIPIQLGGGIRTMETIEQLFDWGLQTVILGTVACRDPEFVVKACQTFPGRISVGIDARDGQVAVRGWAEVTDIADWKLAQRFENAGVSEIIHTDIHRDGALTGPNVKATRRLAEKINIPVIVSGGVSSLADIKKSLKHSGPFDNGNVLSGVITGRALYDGRLDFRSALKAAKAKQSKKK